jgi:hypothetical protein
MTKTVTITLIAGIDTGPFDLYSDADLYTIPFESGLAGSLFISGYTSTLVPSGATIIKVVSLGKCSNCVDLVISTAPIPSTTTTTSTTTIAPITTTSTTTVEPTTTSTTTSTTTVEPTTTSTTTTSTTTVEPTTTSTTTTSTTTIEPTTTSTTTTSTTTSTTTIPPVLYNYTIEALWELDDPAHPGGGYINYIDSLGTPVSLTGLWIPYSANITVQSITTSGGISIVPI